MVRRSLVLLTVVVGVVSFGSLLLVADGIILPDHPEFGWLSIVNHDVTVTLRDGVATTYVDQVFRNDTGRVMEGEYVFPLPPGAVVTGFTLWVDGQALEGRVLEADEARHIYEDYVRRSIDPALLEYIGRDTLSARIFPIPPGEERRIEITYTELLVADQGMYRYRYPLDTERFSARNLESVTISLDLETTVPLSAVYSPTHKITIERDGAFRAAGLYEALDVLPLQDFLLYYAVSAEELGMTLLTYKSPGEDGYFLLIATPPAASMAAEPLPKDLVLVIDQSGSMSGEKIEQAKDALSYILENLNPDDRFAVIAFSDFNDALSPELVQVSGESIQRAIGWVERIEASGGTHIDGALNLGFSLFEDNERPRFLVFLTDGEPTVGEQDPVVIAEHARVANRTEARLFAFGVGYNVNTVLLDQLTQENRGSTTYVLPGENLEVSLSSFYRKIASPVLANTELEIAGVETLDVLPRVLPDIFRGTQLIVLGRYRGSGPAQITISGDVQGVPTAYASLLAFPETALDEPFLLRLWAGRKIAALLDQIRLYGESDELVDEVIRLSERYGIITPYTSFLVEDDELAAEEMADAVRMSAAPAAGASAVQGSSALKTLAEGETVQTGVERVRIVEERTYFLREGIWVDSRFADEVPIEIVAFSAAYFELIDIAPWIAPHLAIGEQVIVKMGEGFVHIGPEGLEELSEAIIDALTG